MDEAVGDAGDAADAAAQTAAAAPAAAAPRTAATARSRAHEPSAAAEATPAADLDRIVVSGTRIFPPVAEDASLPPEEWLARIRDRRDAGTVDDARESLRRFIREYPRRRLPEDLRELRSRR